MTAQLVPCPRGGACGSPTHDPRSKAYAACCGAASVRGGAQPIPMVSPSFDSAEASSAWGEGFREAQQQARVEELNDLLQANHPGLPVSTEITDVERDGSYARVQVYTAWNRAWNGDPRAEEDAEFDVHVLGTEVSSTPFSERQLQEGEGRVAPTPEQLAAVVAEFVKGDRGY